MEYCPCGQMVMEKVSESAKNPKRRYKACSDPNCRIKGVFQWLDGEPPTKKFKPALSLTPTPTPTESAPTTTDGVTSMFAKLMESLQTLTQEWKMMNNNNGQLAFKLAHQMMDMENAIMKVHSRIDKLEERLDEKDQETPPH